MTNTTRTRADEYIHAGSTPSALLRLALYATALAAPLLVAIISTPSTDHPLTQEIAKNCALVGYSILALQFVLSARLRWIERPFGLDIVFRFHRHMGFLAAALLLVHPILYAAGGEWSLLYAFDHSWTITLGKLAFLALVALVLSTVFRKTISLDFELWRRIHNGLAPSVLLLGFVHSMSAGGDFDAWPMMTLWTILLAFALGSYVHHKWIRPRQLRRDSYEVVRVEQETPDVWSLEFASGNGAPAMDYLPGQFCFLTLHRGSGPVEEHPFTIASAPNASGHIVTTIKASGDYTKTIGQTNVGDRASVFGPFGRFSYLLHPENKDLVFVAGGVGITPMLSMLRHMHSTSAEISVLLLSANRKEHDIIARDELASIAESGHPKLTIVHILSDPDEGWTGETGRLDDTMLRRYLKNFDKKTCYVCGPPSMTTSAISSLRHLGINEHSIHVEPFSL